MIRGRRLGFALVVLVFSITVAAFIPALQGQFLNWDDGLLFTKNLDYRGLGPAQLRWMFTTTLNGHYVPLTWLLATRPPRRQGANEGSSARPLHS